MVVTLSTVIVFQNCASGPGSSVSGGSTNNQSTSQISFNGSGVYTSINPTISFSITNDDSAIQSITFQLDPQGSPWVVEQQNLPANPTCTTVNGTCTGSLTFSSLYATPHTLVLTATDDNGVVTTGSFNFSITLTQAQQVSAATTTATTNINCVGTGGTDTGITPYYWEIGNASSGSTPIASGSVTLGSQTAVTRSSIFEIDSASKMIAGAYALSQNGTPAWSTSINPATKTFLHFASGYTNFQDDSCSIRGLSSVTNSVTAADDDVLACYTACCISDDNNNIIKDSVHGTNLCGNLVNHSNASSMIQTLEASGVISAADAANDPHVECNSDYVPSTAGNFYYSGGHLQRYYVAANTTLAPNPGDGFSNYGIDATGLIGTVSATGATSLATILLTEFNMSGYASNFKYAFPQLAGGVYADANAYAAILQNILGGSLSNYLSYLGKDAICTYSALNAANANYSGVKEDSCNNGSGYAYYSPITQRLFHYSYTDWVEDDPKYGDGAFSSAGKDGEYPWIDASKTYYGLIHRSNNTGATLDGRSPVGQGYQSLLCGSLIREAFFTGVPH